MLASGRLSRSITKRARPFPSAGGADAITDTWAFRSGTAAKDGALVTSGGRVLGVTATGDTLETAIDTRLRRRAAGCALNGMFMRSDIGKRALEVEG